MEVPRKRAKTCPDDDTADGGAAASTAAQQQIAELRAELAKCKREHEQVVRDLNRRHAQMVRDLKGSYSNALEWTYTVKAIPRDHWLEKGHTGEYAGAMEELLVSFTDTIKKLRTGELSTGTSSPHIGIGFALLDEEEHQVTADHDDALMPYWMELAKALIHWSEYHANDKTLEIVIDCIETPDFVLNVLRPAMKLSKVEYLGFVDDGSPRTWKLAAFMDDIIQTNHTVAGVGFNSIVLSNDEWKIICNAIRKRTAEQNSVMSFFGLVGCSVDRIDSEVLEKILTSKSEEVDLGTNRMSSREASIIAQCLNSNPPLARLSLRDNHFNDADAAVLANSLSSNTNLSTLDVDGNNITEEGRLAFLRAIFDVSSLGSCAASNHACQVFGLEKDISALNDYEDRHHNKWEKIFAMLALSSDDSFMNTALLRGIPTYLIPKLLDKVDDQEEEGNSKITDLYLELTGSKRCQNHDVWDNLEDSRSLSCVYDLIRSWVVPSIYV
ncbi:hypothetical protein THAOC_06982 [Thalassiosira oceanica]|uniref:Uncharacterized protein n=1 Tax=Thalassiosira oceanica TaxID=159749 RepID=K0T1D4_THAOC|nr:hypothetical protein THAOC_06982 [Thalassiosira oceanica]|eukprot:EJK71560.1 hypothetical protein THAOC_06982 [Thalassiosira oceanica]